MTQHVERLVGLFVEAHPRATLDRLLSFLAHDHGASGAALCSIENEALQLEGVRSVLSTRVPVLDRAWAVHRPEMLRGDVAQGSDYVLAPLVCGAKLVGLLFLDRPTRFHGEGLSVYLFALGKGLVAAKLQGPETAPGIGVDQREIMRWVLESEEWNVSRVAKKLGVTRRTVYLRMLRYNIKRRRVPRMAKPVV